MNTIAVGPLELVASWVTGCTAVARALNWHRDGDSFHRAGADSELRAGAATACEAVLDSWHVESRSAIATDEKGNQKSNSRSQMLLEESCSHKSAQR